MLTDNASIRRVRAAGSRSGNPIEPGWLTAGLLAILAAMMLVVLVLPADAKTPGSKYCFYGKCHRVKTVAETRAIVGKQITLHASHYDACGRDRYNPCGLTSSGEPFYPHRSDNAASPIYPDGTILLVWHEMTGDAAVIRINNAGPYWGNRKLDVSIETARKLGFAKQGVAALRTMIIYAPAKHETRYRRHRAYNRVPGHIGKFDTMDEAYNSAAAVMAVEAMAGSAAALASPGVVAAARFETRQVVEHRSRTADQVETLTMAMHAGETRWPDFAVAVTEPDAAATPITAAGFQVARRLAPPAKIQTAAIQEDANGNEPAVHSKTAPVNSLREEWLRPSRPAIVLTRAQDLEDVPREWELERGRIEALFGVAGAASRPPLPPYAEAYIEAPDGNFAPFDRYPNPRKVLSGDRKAARAAGKLT